MENLITEVVTNCIMAKYNVIETVQANLRLINSQFKPTWSQFRALVQANHRFTRFRCLFFGMIHLCTYSSSEVIAKSAKKCKIWYIRFCKKN